MGESALAQSQAVLNKSSGAAHFAVRCPTDFAGPIRNAGSRNVRLPVLSLLLAQESSLKPPAIGG